MTGSRNVRAFWLVQVSIGLCFPEELAYSPNDSPTSNAYRCSGQATIHVAASGASLMQRTFHWSTANVVHDIANTSAGNTQDEHAKAGPTISFISQKSKTQVLHSTHKFSGAVTAIAFICFCFAVVFAVMHFHGAIEGLQYRSLGNPHAPTEIRDHATASHQVGDIVHIDETLTEREAYDDQAVNRFIHENFSSSKLLLTVIIALARFWSVLAIMYWELTHDSTALMDCDKPGYSGTVRHACKYTKACLHGYPVIAANLTLALMVRILVQMKLYYSLLKEGCVVDFVTLRIMSTPWPWLCALSMLQGGMHFALKAYHDNPNLGAMGFGDIQTYLSTGSKFLVPGILFMSFFPALCDVDALLVPLNHLVEHEYTKYSRNCPWLSKIQAMNERVLCRDVRRNSVYKRTRQDSGKEIVTISDVVQNLKEHYDEGHEQWLKQNSAKSVGARQQEWVFRAMWPATVLTHWRMDRNDPDTWEWLCVLTLVLTVSSLLSFSSLCLLLCGCSAKGSLFQISAWQSLFGGEFATIPTDEMLSNLVLIVHGLIVLWFLYRSIWGMFFQQLQKHSSDAWIGFCLIVVLFVFGGATKCLTLAWESLH